MILTLVLVAERKKRSQEVAYESSCDIYKYLDEEVSDKIY